MAVLFCESLNKQNKTLNSTLLKGEFHSMQTVSQWSCLKKKKEVAEQCVWNATAYRFTHISIIHRWKDTMLES